MSTTTRGQVRPSPRRVVAGTRSGSAPAAISSAFTGIEARPPALCGNWFGGRRVDPLCRIARLPSARGTAGKSLICIRPARPADAAGIHDVLAEAFEPYRPEYTPEAFALTVPTVEAVLERMTTGSMWVAESDGTVVGTVTGEIRDGYAYLRALAVTPHRQRSGAGDALVMQIRELALERRLDRIRLDTTRFLHGARRLYESFGFVPTGATSDLHGVVCDTLELAIVKDGEPVPPPSSVGGPGPAHYWWGHGCEAWVLWDDAAVAVKQERIPSGTAEVPHFHRISRQWFLVTAGRARLSVDDEAYVLMPGEAQYVAPGSVHHISACGPVALEFILISCPATNQDRVEASSGE